MENTNVRLSVSDFIALTNQVLEYTYPIVEVEGEVASFKVSHNKFVFFDIKDEGGSIGCFMMLWQQRVPIEDGMKVVVTATPTLTSWGKFSLTVRSIHPSGEGSLKKSYELLKAKLDKEGLFAVERKRSLPAAPQHVAVISSTEAAGYKDFLKILDERWGGVSLEVAHVQVQGAYAADQMIKALHYFNSQETIPEVIVIVRGGGSADDLSAFNDELLVREIAMSRVPTLVGVGHEVDISLADMAADVRAATPSNAAQLLVPDKAEVIRRMNHQVTSLLPRMERTIEHQQQELANQLDRSIQAIDRRCEDYMVRLQHLRRVLAELSPHKVLARGYALVRGEIAPGKVIEVEKSDILVVAEVRNVSQK